MQKESDNASLGGFWPKLLSLGKTGHRRPQITRKRIGDILIEKVCNTLIVILLISVLIILLVLGIPLLMRNQIYAVLTPSMEPAYPVGSLVVVEPAQAEEIEMNDVITFDAGSGFQELATHRVIDVDSQNRRFITKGDNNAAEDLAPIPFESLRGRVVYGIPFLGKVVTGIKTPKGIMASAGVLLFMVVLFVLPSFFESDEEQTEHFDE